MRIRLNCMNFAVLSSQVAMEHLFKEQMKLTAFEATEVIQTSTQFSSITV